MGAKRLPFMGLLTGKVAIVTGAGNGIGRAHAHLMAKEGARVLVNDLGVGRDGTGTTASAAQVAEEIVREGGEAMANTDSVSTQEGADRILWSALSGFGQVDILVNNAGILRDRTCLNMKEADFDAVINVHLKGTYLMTQTVGRRLKVQGQGGRIINTSSMSGLRGNFGQCNYAAAKAGIFGFTLTAAQEFARFGTTVNAIAPLALTRMTQDLPAMSGASEETLGPQHIAPVVAFLASDLADKVTGRVFGIHGRRVFEYKMTETAGVEAPESSWSPEGLQDHWDHITK